MNHVLIYFFSLSLFADGKLLIIRHAVRCFPWHVEVPLASVEKKLKNSFRQDRLR